MTRTTISAPSLPSTAPAVSGQPRGRIAPPHRRRGAPTTSLPALAALGAFALAVLAACGGSDSPIDVAADTAQSSRARGQQVFRFDTFGDEIFWSDRLRLHEAVNGVDPATALAVGLKVDAEALPPAVVAGVKDGSISLTSPATTVALLKLGAVVGLQATVENVNGAERVTRLGVTCALCHSTVDDSFAPGIGRRLDGWANRDLNPGAIIALSPALDAATKAVLASWGPGRFDPRNNIDGLSKPVVIPPAYGLRGVHSVTYTGDGDRIRYWNNYVAVVEMGGQGSFVEPRLNLRVTNGTQDLVSDKLPELEAYQLSLATPAPPAGSFDPAAAGRGKAVFDGPGRCATCHSGPHFTDANERLHPASDSMAEPESPSYAARSATRMYRTTPLRALWQHPPYFHDGSAATLEDVVRRYDVRRNLNLDARQQADLVQYLKSL
jgi:mono/diheme cytochrome c family protein